MPPGTPGENLRAHEDSRRDSCEERERRENDFPGLTSLIVAECHREFCRGRWVSEVLPVEESLFVEIGR